MVYKQEAIEYWAQDKGIYNNGGDFMAQIKGVAEEVPEVVEAYYVKSTIELEKELGDIYVFWINACRIAGVQPKNCIDAAFKKINHRDGEMVAGRFVKEIEDLAEYVKGIEEGLL